MDWSGDNNVVEYRVFMEVNGSLPDGAARMGRLTCVCRVVGLRLHLLQDLREIILGWRVRHRSIGCPQWCYLCIVLCHR